MAELDSLLQQKSGYDVGPFRTYVRPVLAEFVGTTLFVFIGVLSVQSGNLASIGLAHGLTIALLIMGLGKISGGHFNPAVSLGVCLSGGITVVLTVAYIVAQILGGMIGAAFVRAILEDKMYNAIDGGAHIPSIDAGWAVFGEIILTTILVLSVLMNAVNDETKNEFAPFAIGFAVAVDIMAAGSTTGASMNPARSFGPAVAGSVVIPQDPWSYHYVYWVGPAGGAVLAALLYRFVLSSNAQNPSVFSISCKPIRPYDEQGLESTKTHTVPADKQPSLKMTEQFN
ncbi:Aquaporin-8 [Mizuhopecten yessoensis]|uniref:Aquaporin-8 n=1 Tax=Mizuhopecten yessoensis TaxID=6573 RepID=A0A210PWH3_MIZYE|nr:Aquaporin-8 [Mizuhopecten yessoensis]